MAAKKFAITLEDGTRHIVTVEEGDGKVLAVDVLKRELKLKMLENENFININVDAVKSIKSHKNRNNDLKENKDLKSLEQWL